jgi:hypothetical protein
VILLLAALVHFAFPVVPVEATIPQVYEYAITINERRINQTRHGVSARARVPRKRSHGVVAVGWAST